MGDIDGNALITEASARVPSTASGETEEGHEDRSVSGCTTRPSRQPGQLHGSSRPKRHEDGRPAFRVAEATLSTVTPSH